MAGTGVVTCWSLQARWASGPGYAISPELVQQSQEARVTKKTTNLADSERRWLDRAVELAVRGPAADPNPRVGAVVLDAAGTLVGEGYHQGAGTEHAETVALRAAGGAARGGTVVVTLEPCAAPGRRPACVDALLAAGVARVVYAVGDPHPGFAGGAARLRAAGVDVVGPLAHDAAGAVTERWRLAVSRGRPWVTLKLALSLDGRVAAADGSSRWVTGPEARSDAHHLRSEHDAIAVGTGTALADDPALTVRRADAPRHRPLRVVLGSRPLPASARLRDHQQAPTMQLATHSPADALAELHDRQVRAVLLEGGPTVAAAWLRAEVVDELVVYVAPVLLGDGPSALASLGITSIAEAWRGELTDVARFGADVRLRLAPPSRDGTTLSKGRPEKLSKSSQKEG